MDKTAFSKLFTALDASGNEVDPSDDTKTIASIRANFGFWGVDYISAKGVSKGSGGTGGASTLYQLVDVLANDTEDGVEGAAAGKALVFDGTHWRAGDAGLNESQLYSYLTANKYLTQSAADSRYVTSSRKVIAGTGLSGGGALTSDVTLSLGTSGVVAGTYTKVMVDAYGRVTSGTNLSSTDIPNLDWSKITTGKPTTLAGYGITDAYTKTEADGKYVTIATAQTVSGAKTFSATMKTSSVLPSTDANSALGGTANRWSNVYSVNGVFSQNVTAKLLSASESLQIGDAYLKWDAANNAVYVIKKDGTTPVGFYSTDWLSAKGVSISGVQTGTLADLNDVEITDPVNGQALKYDAASKKWVNGTIDSFNVNQMWAELKKADSSKIIDASHIPTSVLDGRWVKKTGDTMTGTLTSASSPGSIVFKGLENCDITNIYKDNGVIRNDDGDLTSIRNGLRFNWYDTYWYIGNLRGSSTESAGFGVVDHNNKLVLRVTPNDVRAPVFRSTASQGTAPLIVNSTTQVSNLNADLLDGYHAFGTSNALIKYGHTVGGTDFLVWDRQWHDPHLGDGPDAPLGVKVEPFHGIDGVVEPFDPHRIFPVDGEHVQDIPPDRHLTQGIHLFRPFVAGLHQFFHHQGLFDLLPHRQFQVFPDQGFRLGQFLDGGFRGGEDDSRLLPDDHFQGRCPFRHHLFVPGIHLAVDQAGRVQFPHGQVRIEMGQFPALGPDALPVHRKDHQGLGRLDRFLEGAQKAGFHRACEAGQLQGTGGLLPEICPFPDIFLLLQQFRQCICHKILSLQEQGKRGVAGQHPSF